MAQLVSPRLQFGMFERHVEVSHSDFSYPKCTNCHQHPCRQNNLFIHKPRPGCPVVKSWANESPRTAKIDLVLILLILQL